jgi:hypothetical protein
LVAHTALYGGEHAMGGAYNELLLEVAAVGATGFVAFLAALAWMGTGTTADGSILAARLRTQLPGLAPLTVAAGLWFLLGERVEAPHFGAGIVFILASLLAASWLLLALTRSAVRLLAGAIVAIVRDAFAPRTPAWFRPARRPLLVRRRPLLRRRFARPPPIANARA